MTVDPTRLAPTRKLIAPYVRSLLLSAMPTESRMVQPAWAPSGAPSLLPSMSLPGTGAEAAEIRKKVVLGRSKKSTLPLPLHPAMPEKPALPLNSVVASGCDVYRLPFGNITRKPLLPMVLPDRSRTTSTVPDP